MFENKEDTKYVLTTIAQSLSGNNVALNHKFYIWKGIGRNGKGIMRDFIQRTFGSYYDPMPIEYLNKSKHGESATAADEAIASKKNCRIVKDFEHDALNEDIGHSELKKSIASLADGLKVSIELTTPWIDKDPEDIVAYSAYIEAIGVHSVKLDFNTAACNGYGHYTYSLFFESASLRSLTIEQDFVDLSDFSKLSNGNLESLTVDILLHSFAPVDRRRSGENPCDYHYGVPKDRPNNMFECIESFGQALLYNKTLTNLELSNFCSAIQPTDTDKNDNYYNRECSQSDPPIQLVDEISSLLLVNNTLQLITFDNLNIISVAFLQGLGQNNSLKVLNLINDIFGSLEQVNDYIRVRNDITHYKNDGKFNFDCQLSSLLNKLEVPNCIVGTKFQDKKRTITIDNVIKAGTLSEPDVPALIKLATRSPFGKGSETVFDEQVRRGLQIEGHRIKVEDVYVCGIPPKVLNMLASPGAVIEPKLYKIHIYEQGGHFNTHIDTPHASNHIGTLVLAMGSDYQGGEFIIECGDETKTVKLDINGPNQWIMFYNDCRHRVAHVTSGVRVVMQFDLYQEVSSDIEYNWLNVGDDDGDIAFDGSHYVQDKMVKSEQDNKRIVEGIESTIKRVEGHNLAIMLRHNYYDFVASGDLKTIDALVWQQIKISHPDCYIAPMIVKTKSSYDRSSLIARVGVSIIGLESNHTTMVTGLVCEKLKHLYNQEYIEYTGNEAQPELNSYGVACIVIPNFEIVDLKIDSEEES
eukprot:gene13627-16043_t